ncbi:hypothetical protein M406DRAFT_325240 [Cryphonectria parasitica EP155]|uniref:Uncharacterized protein n=1 Tax=Cryphonectria parasitica (strain ATCC 38755 / EP155) TaxID=660469 RepID=A0A9P4YB38_CRYP1|nr:uncharacterized protein M406DRAFT_325240 [Cryphonectria parasitica EP155]KAF3769754.1 hypothetical protein M406DRAFT_325240 [Cryphonectria parasitica EP155]
MVKIESVWFFLWLFLLFFFFFFWLHSKRPRHLIGLSAASNAGHVSGRSRLERSVCSKLLKYARKKYNQTHFSVCTNPSKVFSPVGVVANMDSLLEGSSTPSKPYLMVRSPVECIHPMLMPRRSRPQSVGFDGLVCQYDRNTHRNKGHEALIGIPIWSQCRLERPREGSAPIKRWHSGEYRLDPDRNLGEGTILFSGHAN